MKKKDINILYKINEIIKTTHTLAIATSTKLLDFNPKNIATILPIVEASVFCVHVKIAGNVIHDKTTHGTYSIKLFT